MQSNEARTFAAHHEVLAGMQDYVAEHLSVRGDIEKIWQPTDYLPDLTRED